MKFKIRKLEVYDFEKGFLESLENLTQVGLTQEEAIKLYQKLDGNCCVFVAESQDGTIVGTAMLFFTQRFIHKGGKVGHLEDVSTRKCFERQGVGSALVRAVVEEAKRQGCYKVILDCGEHNVPFYEKCGFKRRAIEMRMDLI